MPPQPLSTYRSGPPALIPGAEHAIEARPQLAAEIAKCIGVAAEIDTYLGNILALTLGVEAEVALAMYSALLGVQPKEAALKAAAEKVLTPADLEVFFGCQRWAKSAALSRHRFAHWMWAYSPQISDAVLFIDPEAVHDLQRRQREIRFSEAPSSDPHIDRRRVLVYKANDIREAKAELARASIAIYSLMDMLRLGGSERDQERLWLSDWLQAHAPQTDQHRPPLDTNTQSAPRRPKP